MQGRCQYIRVGTVCYHTCYLATFARHIQLQKQGNQRLETTNNSNSNITKQIKVTMKDIRHILKHNVPTEHSLITQLKNKQPHTLQSKTIRIYIKEQPNVSPH